MTTPSTNEEVNADATKNSNTSTNNNTSAPPMDGDEYTSVALSARELEWAINPPEVQAQHKQANGPIVRTRFPPEPNGYLHIGHAKSTNMNFALAFEKLGVPMEHRRTIFRYDDTNPDAETEEFIDSLRRDLEWLGWKPERTTYSSDYFQHLYDFAVQLIQKGLAYVCDMTKAEMEAQRELAMKRANARCTGKDPDAEFPIPDANILPGRNRDTSVERNMELFHKMKLGCFDEGTYTLRLKMDFDSPNPNMYDLVAYRIKYTPHPHAGSGWCIYPAYDFTHGICDSLEDIDYSICTLEFETRREPYYWILWALDLYRPKVYEMSRLNLQYTVLSKRRLMKLVERHWVRGWDDPRMPTIAGLRRRGYTAAILNSFCHDVGATRAQNVVEMNKLDHTARTHLSVTCPRVMAALQPIQVIITNYDEQVASEPPKEAMVHANGPPLTFVVQNSPTDESLGFHTVTLTQEIYVDATDFRLEDDPKYYGLAPNKAVGIKYHGGNLVCDEVIMDPERPSEVKALKCHVDSSPERVKPKSYISWVPSTGVDCEVRVYNHLFTVPEPSDLWEDELHPESEIVYPHARVDPSVLESLAKRVVDKDTPIVDKWTSNAAFQFERMGYFVLDLDTTYHPETKEGKLVFNRTVSLKEEVFKKKLSAKEEAAIEARKERAKADVQAKELRMKMDPIDLFRLGDEYQGQFSQFDATTGIPTHDAAGVEVTKSMMKKLVKEQQKHKKQQEVWMKSRSSQ
jgi:glutaminyl-tRNA synthetase